MRLLKIDLTIISLLIGVNKPESIEELITGEIEIGFPITDIQLNGLIECSAGLDLKPRFFSLALELLGIGFSVNTDLLIFRAFKFKKEFQSKAYKEWKAGLKKTTTNSLNTYVDPRYPNRLYFTDYKEGSGNNSKTESTSEALTENKRIGS